MAFTNKDAIASEWRNWNIESPKHANRMWSMQFTRCTRPLSISDEVFFVWAPKRELMNYTYYAGNRFIVKRFFKWTRNKIYLFIDYRVICVLVYSWWCLPLLPHIQCTAVTIERERLARDRMKIDLLCSYFFAIALRRCCYSAVVTLAACICYMAQAWALHCIHNGHSFFVWYLRENENANI